MFVDEAEASQRFLPYSYMQNVRPLRSTYAQLRIFVYMWHSTNTGYPNIVVTQFSFRTEVRRQAIMPYGNRRHIPQAVKEQIITMSAHMHPSQIARATGISTRTIRRTNELWWKTGAVQRDPIQQGRPRKLNSLDLAVCSHLESELRLTSF